MDNKLKPCPFCGEQPTQERIEPHKHQFVFMPDYPGAWIINCGTCEFRLFSHESIADVENKWNHRTLPPDDLQDDYQEPVQITCERCGRKTSHPEGWHYCGAKEVDREG